jgi:hypothetical protein
MCDFEHVCVALTPAPNHFRFISAAAASATSEEEKRNYNRRYVATCNKRINSAPMSTESVLPLPSGLWEQPFAAAAVFGCCTYALNLIGVVSAMCLAKVSPAKEAYFSAISAGLILASATGGLISGAVTTARSEGIRGALPLSSGLIFALLTMIAFERMLVYLQRRNSAVISWMLAPPSSRDVDDEGSLMLSMHNAADSSNDDDREHAPVRKSREAGAAALHEVIDQTVAGSSDVSRNGPPSEAKVRAAMMLVLAMMVHHVPESMALGVAVYGVSDGSIQQGQCIVLAAVLALQNIPEGAACTSSLRMLGLKNGWRLVLVAQLAGTCSSFAGSTFVIFCDLIAAPVVESDFFRYYRNPCCGSWRVRFGVFQQHVHICAVLRRNCHALRAFCHHHTRDLRVSCCSRALSQRVLHCIWIRCNHSVYGCWRCAAVVCRDLRSTHWHFYKQCVKNMYIAILQGMTPELFQHRQNVPHFQSISVSKPICRNAGGCVVCSSRCRLLPCAHWQHRSNASKFSSEKS